MVECLFGILREHETTGFRLTTALRSLMKCTFLTHLIYHYSEKEHPTTLFSLTNSTFLNVKVFPVHFPRPFGP